jgi:diguanylate cyclase (GGDEF)-like protein/PAS domain S-box-containing protein
VVHGIAVKSGPLHVDERRVLSSLAAPALTLDEHSLVVDANDLALELLRRTREELLGWSVADVVEGYESDGTPVRLKTLRSQQVNGKILCLLRVVQGEELVEDLVSFFDAAFDHAPIGMAILGANGRYVRVNDALCAMLGRRREELIGERDNAITHPDDRDRDVQLAWRILRGELDSAQLEKRFVKPDGSLTWVIANVTYLRDDAGNGIAWVGQFQDVTSRRAAEAELRRERDLSSAMLTAMREGFCLIADDGTVTLVNDAMCELVGLTREELVGQGWPFAWVPEDQVEFQAALGNRWRDAGHGDSDDVVLRRGEGARFNASVTLALATGPGGESLGCVVTIRDISERKRHEADLARLVTHDTLTGLVNHRGFHERLREEIARSRRHNTPLSLAILDLDHFKQVNDTYGHPVGDRVLAEVGRRLRSLSRLGEHVARVGGEEFAWILPGTDDAGAYTAAERARRAIGTEPFAGIGGLTVSVGVCELGENADADELQRLADLALYEAKHEGRNIVVRHRSGSAPRRSTLAGPRVLATERAIRLRAVHAIACIVEQGHPTSDGHAERVADLAAELAERLGWPQAQVRALREAAVLHDVGKIIMPRSMLVKSSAFDEGEWTQMRRHPLVGEDMLEGLLSRLQRTWVRGHHERWDGHGYPDGLAGKRIPDGARILAVADSWDVMTSARGYSEALNPDTALTEVRRCAGRQFDGAVVDVLEDLMDRAPSIA